MKTPSNHGARISHRPCHIDFTKSPKSSKLKPKALSLSTIPEVRFSKIDLIFSQISVILFRKSSFVFQRCTNAATSTAIAATTATTGAEIPPIAALTAENAAFAFVRIAGIPDANCNSVPTVEMVLPTTIKRGPRAAATTAILTMVSFVAGDNALNLSTKACNFETIALIVGMRISPKEMASSCN